MSKHELKIEEKYLDDLIDGCKRFEIRLNDRDYTVGDILKFKKGDYFYEFEVMYIHSGLGLKEGYICMTVGYSRWYGAED